MPPQSLFFPIILLIHLISWTDLTRISLLIKGLTRQSIQFHNEIKLKASEICWPASFTYLSPLEINDPGNTH
jgi:hypothetical protein